MITKIIKNHQLQFDETTHRYTVDGKDCYSVTQVIKWKLNQKYDGVDKETLKKASEYGNRVHSEIEDYEILGVETNSVELSDYKWLKNIYKWKIENSEIFLILPYKDIFICGKIDLLAEIADFKYILDIKTTSVLDKASLGMQLTMYKMAYEYCYGPIDYIGYIWINSKGNNSIRKFEEIQANEPYIKNLLADFYNFLEMGF